MAAGDEPKLAWLRSQLIGSDVEFDTPFGRRRLTYADHTASGRSLCYVEEFILRKVLPFYGNTHTDDSHVGHAMSAMARDASAYVKKCMGAGPDDALLFCGSGSTAAIKRLQEVMGIAVPSVLKGRVEVREEERWVVFVGPYEHHSNVLTWRQSLAEVVEIGVDPDGLVDLDELRSQLGSTRFEGRPKLGSFSACSNVTGIYTDTRALARLLHEHGAFACFDFAASGPYQRINMRSGEMDGYDAVFLSPHKFVGGPGTPGILLMHKALYLLGPSPPSTCGGGTVCYVNGFSEKDTLYYEDIEEREDAGTPPIIQKIRAALAFWVKNYIGHRLIDRQEHHHVEAALDRLLANPRIHILGNTRVRRQPVLSFLVCPSTTCHVTDIAVNKPLHGRFVARLLNDLFGIQARGGCACAGPYGHHLLGISEELSRALRHAIAKGYEGLKPGWTRVSFPYYMSTEEMEFILDAIEFVAEHGHRFLPLYGFDWKSGNWSFRKRALQYRLMEDVQSALNGLSLMSVKGGDLCVDGGRVKDGDRWRFGLYLEVARRVAGLLPEDSMAITAAMRSVPEDVDDNLVLFRV